MAEIVVLTGAGVSAESGVPTFRDLGGIWSQVRLEDVATPEAFARDPDGVHAFYNARRRQLASVAPNAAHRALARLGQALGDELMLVSQNVDDLHSRAGSPKVWAMHGALRRALCAHCGHETVWEDDLSVDTPCPSCAKTGGMRPAVVWFGEMPRDLDRIWDALAGARLFVSIGTSGNVYPAAAFVDAAAEAGAETLEINLEPTNPVFDARKIGRATDKVPEWVDALLGTR